MRALLAGVHEVRTGLDRSAVQVVRAGVLAVWRPRFGRGPDQLHAARLWAGWQHDLLRCGCNGVHGVLLRPCCGMQDIRKSTQQTILLVTFGRPRSPAGPSDEASF